MANLKDWIVSEAGEEIVEGVVIGEMGGEGNYNSEGIPNYDQHPRNKVIRWKEAQVYLDYDFDSGYGAPGCEAIYAWTATRVIAIGQYDGSTWAYSIPRHLCDCMPQMQGR